MGEVLLDAFLDTLKVLPFLLLMNFFIEFLEYRSDGLKADRLLKGPFAPFIGTVVGVVPQCGFSVVATELYGKRKIALGTILAVYIATSDEALPIMLSSYAGMKKILPVLIIKICFALIVGYAVFGLEKLSALRKKARTDDGRTEAHSFACENGSEGEVEHESDGHAHDCEHTHVHGCHRHSLDAEAEPISQNATGKQKAAYVWNNYLKHPLLHTATVLLFILIVNVAFGTAVYYIGEQRLADFVGKTGYFQPLLAAVVGLIPNCAASVVLTELYVVGGLNLGGVVAGLSVGAGIGYAVLVKQNRPAKNTALIIVLMFVLSVSLGLCITALGL